MDTPFRAGVNGRGCIVHAGAAGLRIEHGSGSRRIPYGAVRCVQLGGRRVTLNAELDGRLLLYQIDSDGARRLYELLLSGCPSSEISGAGSRARNSNQQAPPSSSHDSRSRVP